MKRRDRFPIGTSDLISETRRVIAGLTCPNPTVALFSRPGTNTDEWINRPFLEPQEIAAYGCLREWVLLLGRRESSRLLEEVLDQEKAANQSLVELARFRCNNEVPDAIPATLAACDRFGHETLSFDPGDPLPFTRGWTPWFFSHRWD